MKRTLKTCLAVIALAISSVSPALAQEVSTPSAPQTTTATYQFWTLRCDNAVGNPPRRICEVAQTIMSQDDRNALAHIVIGKPDPDKPSRLIIQVPTGVWLPDGPTVTADDEPIASAIYRRCVQMCYADTDLDDAALDVLKRATSPAKLIFFDGARRRVELPVPLDGFNAALAESTHQGLSE